MPDIVHLNEVNAAALDHIRGASHAERAHVPRVKSTGIGVVKIRANH